MIDDDDDDILVALPTLLSIEIHCLRPREQMGKGMLTLWLRLVSCVLKTFSPASGSRTEYSSKYWTVLEEQPTYSASGPMDAK